MNGFEERDGVVPEPPVQIEDDTRDRLVRVILAIINGATPEELVGYLADGFPPEVDEALARPLEAEEISDHVDVVLSTLQTPALSAV